MAWGATVFPRNTTVVSGASPQEIGSGVDERGQEDLENILLNLSRIVAPENLRNAGFKSRLSLHTELFKFSSCSYGKLPLLRENIT